MVSGSRHPPLEFLQPPGGICRSRCHSFWADGAVRAIEEVVWIFRHLLSLVSVAFLLGSVGNPRFWLWVDHHRVPSPARGADVELALLQRALANWCKRLLNVFPWQRGR